LTVEKQAHCEPTSGATGVPALKTGF